MRITNTLRQKMITNIITKKFTAQVDPVIDQIKTIAEGLAGNFYSKEISDWMEAKPKDAPDFTTISYFYLQYEYEKKKENGKVKIQTAVLTHSYFKNLFCSLSDMNTSEKKIQLTKSFSILDRDRYNTDLTFKLNSKEIKIMKSLIDELDAIKEKQIEVTRTLTGALYSCNTKKQLQDHFPDLVQYLPAETIKPNQQIMLTNNDVAKALAA